jgi:ribosomal protein S18 acetylase RimI-like enzyme
MAVTVIRLTSDDAERYALVRRRMLTESPWAFASTPGDDVALDLAHLRSMLGEKENAIVAVEAVHALIATAGIFRMKSPKFAHRAKLWGVFVDASHRRRGLGRAVVAAAIQMAKSWQGVEFIDLGVSDNSPEARHLYASLGFKEWGREPETTQHNGRRYDEIYMALRIGRDARA